MLILVFCSPQERGSHWREQSCFLDWLHNQQLACDRWDGRPDHGEWHFVDANHWDCKSLWMQIIVDADHSGSRSLWMQIILNANLCECKSLGMQIFLHDDDDCFDDCASDDADDVAQKSLLILFKWYKLFLKPKCIWLNWPAIYIAFINEYSMKIWKVVTSVNSPAAQTGCRGHFDPQNSHRQHPQNNHGLPRTRL